MSTNRFTPGPHTFTSPAKNLTFEYVIHQPPSSINTTTTTIPPSNLIIVQCPGWGLGSDYLQSGFSDLWTPSPETSPNRNNPTLYTVLFFHPRGTDGSSRPQDPTQMASMPDMASDLEDLRQHLQLDQYPVLLGHSNGGAIALGYTEMYPSRVDRLILLNHQVVGIQDRRISELEATRDDPAYRGAWHAMLTRRADTDDEFTASVQGIWPLYFFDPERWVDELLAAIGDRTMSVWCYHAQGRCDRHLEDPMQMVHRMRDVCAKTLIIFGDEDMICGMRIAERTVNGIPGARLICHEECGHFPWIEQRARTMGDIRGFIEGAMDQS